MKAEDKTKEQIIKEPRQRIDELDKTETLRKRAEKTLQRQTGDLQELSDKDVQNLVHELGTHQIELEMQNEELRKTQSELEEARNRYSNLYDFAPIGYFTFDKNGLIIEVNLTGANILGIERSFLIKTPFSLYVAPDNIDDFHLHLRHVFRTESKQTCEIKLVSKNKNQFYAQLQSLVVQDSEGNFSQCRTAISDITERKKAEEAIRESEERYRSLFESANDIIAMVSPGGIIISLNPAFERITGWAREEWLGKKFTPLIHPDDLPIAMEVFKHTMNGETMPSSELRLLANSGSYVYTEYLTTPVLKDGKVVGNLNIVRDITERKRVEEALRESERRERKRAAELATVLDAMPTPVFIIHDPDSLHITGNRAADELLRLPRGAEASLSAPAEAKPRHFRALKDGRELRHDELPAQRAARGTHVRDFEFSLAFDDGTIRHVLGYGTPLLDEQGRPRGAIHILIDITERKQAEEKIREQAALLDKAHDAISLRTLEQNLIYWNKGAEYLYGWTAEEAIGKNAYELLYKGKPSKLIEAEKNIIEKGEWMGELEQITKDGKEIIVQSRWTLVCDSEEKPKSILIINTDITEMKKLEAGLLHSQRLESIGTLAGGIAHDLNNVLTPIMISVQMLREKFKDEQSQRLLTILENSSQRGANLIKQIMLFVKGVEGERKPLQVTHILSETEKVAKETFNKNIEIRTDISKDLLTISGDATQLHQVIMNLCVNARDAMPDGGILSISAENFFIDGNYARMHTEAKVGSYIVITVSDTGTGISPEVLDRIFEPFFTTKALGRGTGLGLSTALGIVKSYGGFINVYSEVGEGTTFKVYLPAFKTEIQGAQMQQPELPTGQGELILVAEDEGSIREITRSTLETFGYEVITAEDGADAVALYAQNRDKIKVILMDMMMPVMDGQASIRAIRKINPEVKIIAVSGLAEKEKLENIADHTNAFLLKPYTSEKLLKTIHEVLSAK